jgi:hypothetical protein
MVSTRQQKQALAAVSNPLRDAGILKRVFTFLPGCWLFLGAVCREWKDVYAGIEESQQVRCYSLRGRNKFMTCCTKSTCYSAAVSSPAAARLAHESGLQVCTEEESLQLIAGLHADIETLALLRELGMPLSEILVEAVALSGRLSTLQHLVAEPGCSIPDALSYYAARSGSISMLQWLRAEDLCAFNKQTCAGAARGGHLAALRHLRSEGCDWQEAYIADYAGSSGSVAVVEWLRQQQGIRIDAEVMSYAAGAGQLAMCQHLRSTGCDWDTEACAAAALDGHLDTLRWLRAQGCPWDVNEVCIEAANKEFIDILNYVTEQGEVLEAKMLTLILCRAGFDNKPLAAQWLRQHGAQWPAVLQYVTQQWSDVMIAWARAEGCTSPV